jgi:glycosyltransferase involved in cell wall biosynthesis
MSMVTIIMATYNGERYIEEQIESILASTYQDFELYIFDDGSKDNTMHILKGFEKEYPDKIHVRQNEVNLGVTMNFLHGLCRTTSDYVMFCDQDDVWKPNKIALTLKRMRQMEAQTGKEIPLSVFTDAVVVDKELQVLKESFFQSGHLNPRKTDLPHLLMENKLIGCTVMVNASLRKIIQSHPLPKEARFHDWWVALIASCLGKICCVREGTLLYRQHGNNVVGDIGFFSYFMNRISSLHTQKESLVSLQKQAGEFCCLYGELLTDENKRLIQQFATLSNVNFIHRRIRILRNRYYKTGLARNVGLFIIV